ncbi:MAG: hypothetical protein CMM47_00810 [Rhodospirillaceae bacterium]|nr:hypothetical protein [Rhodospirillaceae bacterium]
MHVTLYEHGTNRSARVRWTALEAGIDYQAISRPDLIGSDELRRVHPLAKLPAAEIDGRPLFESTSICTYLADHAPVIDLIANPGSWARAKHDQWVAFTLAEMDAWLWNTAINKYVLPENQRMDAGFTQNNKMFQRSAAVLDRVLSHQPFLVEDRFTVTDIIVGWSVNWGRRTGNLKGFNNLKAYLDRLFQRPFCTLNPD